MKRWLKKRCWLASVLQAGMVISLGLPPAGLAQKAVPPPTSLMSRIRSFLGVQPRTVSVGGSRHGTVQQVCLLAPGPVQTSGGVAWVSVLNRRPALVLSTALNELEIRRGDRVLWSQLASSRQPITGQLRWPLAPLEPGERLELAFRPRGASGGDWAVVSLEGASAEAQQRFAAAVEGSRSNGMLRLQQVEQAVAAGDAALAAALLWAPRPPGSNGLVALQQELQASCQTTPDPR